MKSETDLQAVVDSLSDDKVVNLSLAAVDQEWKSIQAEFEARHVWIDQLAGQVCF